MTLERLLQRMRDAADEEALIHGGRRYLYRDLLDRRLRWAARLEAAGIGARAVVGLRSDYSLDGIAALLALLGRRCVVALLSPTVGDLRPLTEDGRLTHLIDVAGPGTADALAAAPAITALAIGDSGTPGAAGHAAPQPSHPLLEALHAEERAGLIIFTSGTTGRPKAVLHDLQRFLQKFETAPKRLRTLTFLLFDHIAGLDTLFYILASGGTVIIPQRRDPASICRLIQDCHVEVLPASPTFLNLLCLSGEHENFDLSSLRIITYGSEPMPEATLIALERAFPHVRVLQKYGTSEFGSPRSISREGNSLWIRLDGDGMETKVVDNVLWVRSASTMLGYLNADYQIDADGWYCTGDEVEVDGEWIRILGRRSEIINVGGEKVYPAEVESILQEMDHVLEARVEGEPHPLTGNIVVATVRLDEAAPPALRDPRTLTKTVRAHCKDRLARFKMPVKVTPTTESLAGERQKKRRA